jgi:hypothetical protein
MQYALSTGASVVCERKRAGTAEPSIARRTQYALSTGAAVDAVVFLKIALQIVISLKLILEVFHEEMHKL